ncbi:hypothetical protein LZ31DRAFT_567127 [Colletotrichum somersetense]|nr:hypothetical protein LZ31DRAFT_567127 [Colletotrichum somersetense]
MSHSTHAESGPNIRHVFYFSSLERLHFASLAPAPTPPPKHLDLCRDPSDNGFNPKTLKQRRRERQARLAADQSPDRSIKTRSSRRAVGPRSSSSSVYVRLPDKIKKRHLATEEQIIASRNRRHDIILDPAGEALYKVRRRASSLIIQDELWSPTLSVRPRTMENRPPSQEPQGRTAKPAAEQMSPQQKKKRDSFYDSFRWLEEDDELDLRLQLDDYHANLRDDLPANPKQRRPSFRRHLSITKIPFGRTSLSSSRPGTTPGVISSPSSPRLQDYSSSSGSPHAGSPNHGRRRSRALSLISPKHSPQDTLAAFDPEAAHYKDPEARLKLRVYLACPQKFDEAIEFGFPSKEAMVSRPPGRNAKQPKARSPKPVAASDETENMRTFLADDRSSISSDDGSLDSDSPKTPHTMEMAGLRPPPIKGGDQAQSPKPSTEYARMPAEAREMTLRMTLTRPDLRAHEDQMYGWQKHCAAAGRKSTNAVRSGDDFPTALYVRDASSKESIERQFAAMDQENAQAGDQGVMKRFWNKVRRGPA